MKHVIQIFFTSSSIQSVDSPVLSVFHVARLSHHACMLYETHPICRRTGSTAISVPSALDAGKRVLLHKSRLAFSIEGRANSLRVQTQQNEYDRFRRPNSFQLETIS